MEENLMFKQRLQAGLVLIEAKLIWFKVKGMSFTAAAEDRHEEQFELGRENRCNKR